ncbi:MAG: GtrA family protein [Tannerellaceae bacterium]|jgi:putative flippase GtrA|nr:GtrA family protein [Tannerellaceae bacterium]
MTAGLPILQFLKFCAVGFSGMMIDFGLTWYLKEKAKTNRYIANTCGFIAAAASNYIWNRIWTFRSVSDRIAAEFLSFFLIALFGVGLNNLILWILSDKFGFNFYLSKLLAVGVVTLWNFGMNYLFTFA